ncbi:MAG: SCO family protein [Alphaproteobacteria bacterium]|nr:SCO family protein [Alphaproteobacteria bacterium]
MSSANRGLLVFLVVLAVLVAGFGYENGWYGNAPPTAVPVGGPFTLTDQNGAMRTDAQFRGKLMLVYFGYTYCPDTCPATLAAMTQALAQLGPAADAVQPIFITVDPARDTPAQLKSYAANFSPRLIALTGTSEQLQAIEREYRVYASKVPGGPPDDYLLDHSSFIYLMGRDGKLARLIPSGETPADMAADIRKHL